MFWPSSLEQTAAWFSIGDLLAISCGTLTRSLLRDCLSVWNWLLAGAYWSNLTEDRHELMSCRVVISLVSKVACCMFWWPELCIAFESFWPRFPSW